MWIAIWLWYLFVSACFGVMTGYISEDINTPIIVFVGFGLLWPILMPIIGAMLLLQIVTSV